ncbi:S-DNA-T family DNA segregation ATPase FtsK/SpoIIIE [Lysinibacillus composti]|uniref:DNA translocase FtsK n=1 Tax=Lysinibacillus composti TaxID=720633 RepID=A0A3N9UKX2_9BACI|nr:DNA translocase FtsK [Lysinibacillus composti]MBM7606808.1 S-DNA-T family DNA segregation ATPase FtsK/SpoIIIE [Lysinibacillus composti]RQW76579.1 DNA translocase FtsK [Lysinibacillus composti]
MNWFKKHLSKLFLAEIDDDDDELIEYENEKEENVKNNPQQINQVKKASFRFPVISDDELDDSKPSMKHSTKLNRSLESHGDSYSVNYVKSSIQLPSGSQVYDVEVSRIRELLEKRQKKKGKPTRVHHSIQRVETQKVEKVPIRQEKNRPQVPKQKEVEQNTIDPYRKRFVPSKVPSPIYGYSKPSPLNELLTKRADEEPTTSKDIDSLIYDKGLKNERDLELNKVEVHDEYEYVKENKEVAATMEIIEEQTSIEKVENQNTVEKIEAPLAEKVIDEPIVIEKQTDVKTIVVSNEVIGEQMNDVHVEEQRAMEVNEVQITEESTNVIIEQDAESNTYSEENELSEQEINEQANINEDRIYEKNEEVSRVADDVVDDVVEGDSPKFELNDEILEMDPAVNRSLEDGVLHEETTISQLEDNNMALNEENAQESFSTKKEESKGSKLPFNVLMLKSDKEKLALKEKAKSLLYVKNNNHTQLTESTQPLTVKKEVENLLIQNNDDHDLNVPNLSLSNPVLQEGKSTEEQEVETETLQTENVEEITKPIVVNTSNSTEETPMENTEEVENSPVFIEAEQVVKAPTKVYVKPSIDYLSPPEEKTQDRDWMDSQADILVEALSHFQVTAQIESIMQGPAVTQFEITVGHGTKVSKIRNLADDLKLALAAKDIRIQAPIPGKSSIGIEIPNRISRAVRLSEVTTSESFQQSESPLEAALGLDLTGKPVTIDLRKMPHGLIAGATGSGKSVCINSILVSLLYKADPHELKLMLIDPKMVELAPFNHIPHLVSPVITDVKAATAALKWAVEEMENRYQLFAHAGARDLPRYNKLAEANGEYNKKLPYILIVIDELADLMMMSPADVEEAIARIAQKARACGIHLILATQRPSVDVITGLIKSNIPTRIAFAVSSQIDSRTILDAQGAERLLGRGDMLYLGNGMSAPTRLQGTFVTDDEIEEVIEHVRQQGEPDYFFQQEELLKKAEVVEEQDELFEEVCRFVFEQGTASTSSIQRKYHIGYNRAARLIDMLEKQGFVSEQRGSKPREVYITESDLTSMFE